MSESVDCFLKHTMFKLLSILRGATDFVSKITDLISKIKDQQLRSPKKGIFLVTMDVESLCSNMMFCEIWYQQFKKCEKHGGVLLLVKLQAFTCFFTLFRLYKWYQIAQGITY